MLRHLKADAQLDQQAFLGHDLIHNMFGPTGVLRQYGDTDADGDEDAVYLSPLALGLAALLLIINGLLSLYLSLGLHRSLGIAAVRQALQLMILYLAKVKMQIRNGFMFVRFQWQKLFLLHCCLAAFSASTTCYQACRVLAVIPEVCKF